MDTSGSIHRDKVDMKQTSPIHPEQRLRMGEALPLLSHTSPSQKTDNFTSVIYIISGVVPNIMHIPLTRSALIRFSMGCYLVPEFL
jgi:hypothetical protein